MEVEFNSSKTCELLARQLVEEQAELLKRTSLVKSIKETIREKKLEVIKYRTEGKLFKIHGDRCIVTEVRSIHFENEMCFALTFVAEATNSVEGKKLTKKESDLIIQYEATFKKYKNNYWDKNWVSKIIGIANELACLKNGIRLIDDMFMWGFGFDDATKPGFFDETGIYIQVIENYQPKKYKLEELRVRNRI